MKFTGWAWITHLTVDIRIHIFKINLLIRWEVYDFPKEYYFDANFLNFSFSSIHMQLFPQPEFHLGILYATGIINTSN